MPHAIKMQEKFGKDGYVSVLMESQGLAPEDLFPFMLQRFPKNRGLVLPGQSGIATDPPSRGIPNAALIGVDGTVLFTGNPNSAVSKLEDLIDAETKKIKTGWGKTPEIKKARGLMYGKGQLAEAQKVLDAADQAVKPESRDDFDQAKAELLVRYEARKKAIPALMEDGRFVDAQKRAVQLQKDVKGKAEWEAEIGPLVEAFKSPENDKEIKADQALTKLIAALGDKAPGADAAGPFKALAKKNEGTKVAARAETFATACTYKKR